MKDLKRFAALGMAMALAFSLAACGSSSSSESEASGGASADLESSAQVEEESGDIDESGDEYQGEFTMSQEEVTLAYGRGTNLDVYDADGDVTWTSSDPDAVSIEEYEDDSSYIMITGIKAGGSSTITATDSTGAEVTCEVSVISAGLQLQDDRGYDGAYSTGTYALGKEHQYKVFYDGVELDASDMTWESYDENIATVADDGTVTMVGEGITYICATDSDGNKAFASVWVSKTDDEYEFETTTPSYGMYFEYTFMGYEEHVLEDYDIGGSASWMIDSVYDDGEQIDPAALEWSIEDVTNHPIDFYEEEQLDDEDIEVDEDDDSDYVEVELTYTGEAGQAFLVATNPDTGHVYRYLIVVLTAE